jgi:Ca2+-binding EF-hand superfamily protein
MTEKVLELLQPVRYKPTSVEEMSRETKFTKSEVKFLYRAFKQDCPNGIIDEGRFKDIYENMFPLGDASKYAHLVFHAIDTEDTGGITFGDFMEFLSVMSKGSTEHYVMLLGRNVPEIFSISPLLTVVVK